VSGLCHRRHDCRLCGGRDLTRVLSLAPTPPANAFVAAAALEEPQPLYPLDWWFCRDCTHVQLLDVVDAEALFGDYVYVSGTSPVFVRHFEDYAAWAVAELGLEPGDLVVDVGSNDGTLLSAFKGLGMRVLGVDPAREIARRASAAGIETEAAFFDLELARRWRAEHGPARCITANNVFAHIDDLAGVAQGVRTLLADDGAFVFEVSYLVDVYEKTLFDTIYHEHLDYHSVQPLIGFFARHGLRLVAAQRVPSHGGSLRGVARSAGNSAEEDGSVQELVALERRLGLDRAETLERYGARIQALGQELRSLVTEIKAAGKSLAGFGAPAKATTLMHQFGLGPDEIDFIVDDSPLKQGLFTPGLHIPVLPSSAIAERRPDYLIVLAWNFAEPIMAKHQAFREAGGHFIVPLPSLEVY
jgi:SAM-dependent methyltransferase